MPLGVLRLFISSGFIGEDTFSMSSCAACTARAAAVFISHESFFRGNQGFQLALNLDNVSEPIVQWIGWKIYRKPWFLPNIGVPVNFPIIQFCELYLPTW